MAGSFVTGDVNYFTDKPSRWRHTPANSPFRRAVHAIQHHALPVPNVREHSHHARPGERSVARGQASGRRLALHGSVISDDGPTFSITSLWDSLADWEKWIAAPPSDPTMMARISALQRKSQWGELRRIIVEAPAGAGPAAFVHRMRFTAAPGRIAELRDLFIDRVNTVNAAGDRGTLSAKMTGAQGVLVWSRFFSSLAELEQRTTAALADPAGRAYVEKTGV